MRALLLSTLALLVSLLTAVVASPSDAHAADAKGPPTSPSGKTFEEWRAHGEEVVSLRDAITTDADGNLHSVVVVQSLDAKLAKKGSEVKVYDGYFAFARLAVRKDTAAVLLYRRGVDPKVEVHLVDLAAGTSKTVALARTAPQGFFPTSAILCDDADGFTLVWQEQNPTQPNSVHSTFARVKPDGTTLSKPTSVAIEWALGAIVSTNTGATNTATSKGYMLAVRYEMQGPDATRICFVDLDDKGAPQKHPWWGTRAGRVDEIQMLVVEGVEKAVYRSADSVLVSTVDSSGQWGQEPAVSDVIAKSGVPGPFAVRTKAAKIELVRP